PPVNQPPVANAGKDTTITLPTNSVTLNGTGSVDPDGTIAAYRWAVVSGPPLFTFSNQQVASPVITNLQQGTYIFRLFVTDDKGAESSDDFFLVVLPIYLPVNQPPVANAGKDTTITLPTNSVTLNGAGSFDPD